MSVKGIMGSDLNIHLKLRLVFICFWKRTKQM